MPPKKSNKSGAKADSKSKTKRASDPSQPKTSLSASLSQIGQLTPLRPSAPGYFPIQHLPVPPFASRSVVDPTEEEDEDHKRSTENVAVPEAGEDSEIDVAVLRFVASRSLTVGN